MTRDVVTIPPRAYGALLAEVSDLDPLAADVVPRLVEILPGADELLRAWASYVCDLPNERSEQSLFSQGVRSAVSAVSSLGVRPWTKSLFRDGYSVMLTELMRTAPQLARVRVSWASGSTWRASDGPFLPHRSVAWRVVDFDPTAASNLQVARLHGVLFSHLAGIPALSRAGPRWRELIPA